MKKFLLMSILIAIGGVTCAQTRHSITQSQARMIETDMGAITAPIIVELGEISAMKIVDTTTFDISIFRDADYVVGMLSEYKQYALAKYCTEHGYDIIVNALFQIFTNKNGDKLSVVISGFPARYKKFRPATKEDNWMLPYSGRESDNSKKIIR